MTTEALSLQSVYAGWDSHQLALVQAITGLTSEHLAYRPTPRLRSVGEIISHIALGRLSWFYRMGAPGSADLARRLGSFEEAKADTEHVAELHRWMDATSHQEEAITTTPSELLSWLEATWQMVDTTLTTWTIADLAQTFRHVYEGETYAVSRQWVLWRILAHDLHHGGEVAILLGMLGRDIPDLGEQGGHLTPLPVADPPASA